MYTSHNKVTIQNVPSNQLRDFSQAFFNRHPIIHPQVIGLISPASHWFNLTG